MKASPMLLPDLYLRDGVVFGTNRRVVQYRVQGLADGADVSIAEFGGRWRVFGANIEAARSFGTAEDAFAAFRYEVVRD